MLVCFFIGEIITVGFVSSSLSSCLAVAVAVVCCRQIFTFALFACLFWDGEGCVCVCVCGCVDAHGCVCMRVTVSG